MASGSPSVATSEADPGAAPAANDVLNGLGVGVLAVDAGGVVRYRNERARELLSDAQDLESAFPVPRVLGPFEGWAVELSRVLTQGQDLRLECAIPRPDSAAPT